ncbi:aflatoxin B1 aldehyde reductase member 2 [Colletotrichum filicis]|nr:aflatoxin B1 aldehyde reductase member 2 [Colletotrichum filicis]
MCQNWGLVDIPNGGLRTEAGQVQSALSATPSISRGQPSEPLENENSFPSGSTGLRNVKTEHFEEDQVYVGEEDQVLENYEEEDYEEDEGDPDAKETDSDYGNEPYDLDDMKACLKEPAIQRLGVPGSPAASNVVSWGEHGAPVQFEVSIGKSLSDLQTSTVETMFLHFPDRQTPFEDTIKAIGAALNQGKFKNHGLSDYSTAEVLKVLGICEQNGSTKPSVPAAGGLFSGHKASSGRWKSDNFIDIAYGDAIIFIVFKLEQLYSILNALEAGPLPEDLAAAITAVYSKVQGAEPPYHL